MYERMKFVARRLAGEPRTLPGVRNLPQDRLQDLCSLPGLRGRRTDRQKPSSLSLCQ